MAGVTAPRPKIGQGRTIGQPKAAGETSDFVFVSPGAGDAGELRPQSLGSQGAVPPSPKAEWTLPNVKDLSATMGQKLKGPQNFDNWKFCIKFLLAEHKVLDVVLGKELEPPSSATQAQREFWEAKNRRAMIIIASSVEESQMTYLKRHTKAAEVWERLERVYNKKAMAHRLLLKAKFQELRQRDGETIQAFSNRIEELAHELEGAGAPIQEEEQVLKFLSGVNSKFKAVVVALEAMDQDMDYVSVVNKLLHAELRMEKDDPHQEVGGAALQTRDGKEETQVGQTKPNKPRGPIHQGKGCFKHEGVKDRSSTQCFYCGNMGHTKWKCWRYMRDTEEGSVKADAVQRPRRANGGGRDPWLESSKGACFIKEGRRACTFCAWCQWLSLGVNQLVRGLRSYSPHDLKP